MNHQSGFTLIELVAVTVVISILAAFASSYYSGSGTIAERSFRAEMITAAKYAQQQSMMDTAEDNTGARLRCYRFAIVTAGSLRQFGPQRNSGSGYQYFGEDYPVTVTNGLTTSPNTQYIYFDSLGNSVTSCTNSNLLTATVSVVGDTTIQFKVETNGYVHAI